jgi:hypothetical protein
MLILEKNFNKTFFVKKVHLKNTTKHYMCLIKVHNVGIVSLYKYVTLSCKTQETTFNTFPVGTTLKYNKTPCYLANIRGLTSGCKHFTK